MLVAIDEGFHFSHAEKAEKSNSIDRQIIDYYADYGTICPETHPMIELSLPPHLFEYRTIIKYGDHIDDFQIMDEGFTNSYCDINTFMKRYFALKNMPDLPPDMYQILFNKYISDVPDDPAPYPEKIIVEKRHDDPSTWDD